MKQLEYEYRVQVRIEFTRAELAHLIAISESHYDGVCKSASKIGGFLYGMNNRLSMAAVASRKVSTVEWTFDNYDLQTLCKITEAEGTPATSLHLHFPLLQILKKAIAESEKLNAK